MSRKNQTLYPSSWFLEHKSNIKAVTFKICSSNQVNIFICQRARLVGDRTLQFIKYKLYGTSLNPKSLYWTVNKISSFYLRVGVAKTTESGSSCISIYSHKSKRNWLMTCSCEKMVVYARHKSFSSFSKYPIGDLGLIL